MERFWSKVRKSDGCWEWTASVNAKGYGRFGVTSRHIVAAHRFAYELVVGPIPDDQWVLHRCDNPRCVRPDHLFTGSPLDNSTDMVSKGRGSAQRAWATGKCKRGHDITDPANLRINSRGERQCRWCLHLSKRNYRERHSSGVRGPYATRQPIPLVDSA